MKLIRKIVTHFAPHLDEYFGGLIAKTFGWSKFHFLAGMTYEEVVVADDSIHKLSEEHPDWLCLGIGGGPYDDHRVNKKKSCCLLMAEDLGVQEDPRLVVLLQLITQQDKKGTVSPDQFTLPRAINFMHRHGFTSEQMQEWSAQGITPATAIRQWVEEALTALIDSEALLLEKIKSQIGTMASKEAFQTELRARFFKTKRPWDTFSLKAIAETFGDKGSKWFDFGKEVILRQQQIFQMAKKVAVDLTKPCSTKFGDIRLMVVDGSDGRYSPFEVEFDTSSRSKSVGADLVLVRNSQGHTLIAANPGFEGSLAGFVRVLRIAEAKKRGQEFPKEYYIVEGSVSGFDTWYVHEGIDYRRIYNGTTTRPIVDFSELSLEEIKDLLLKWLSVDKIASMPIRKGPENLGKAFEGTPFEKKAADAS